MFGRQCQVEALVESWPEGPNKSHQHHSVVVVLFFSLAAVWEPSEAVLLLDPFPVESALSSRRGSRTGV
jgi:hypothetical protein